MDRRGALSLLGLLLVPGCAGTRPQATGPRTPPTPGEPEPSRGPAAMGVTDLDVEEADDGHLRVLATVTNRGTVEHTQRLRITVSVGDAERRQSRNVTVPAGAEREFAFDFDDVAYDDFSGNGSLRSQLG